MISFANETDSSVPLAIFVPLTRIIQRAAWKSYCAITRVLISIASGRRPNVVGVHWICKVWVGKMGTRTTAEWRERGAHGCVLIGSGIAIARARAVLRDKMFLKSVFILPRNASISPRLCGSLLRIMDLVFIFSEMIL